MKPATLDNPVFADKTLDLSKGTLKVTTAQGTFLISAGMLDPQNRHYSSVILIPVHHPGKKKVLLKRYGKNHIAMTQCKTAKL